MKKKILVISYKRYLADLVDCPDIEEEKVMREEQ